jgi:hypothetical protein
MNITDTNTYFIESLTLAWFVLLNEIFFLVDI